MTVDRTLNKSSLVKTMVVDVCMLILLYYLPTLSHLIAIPLYCFEPMRIALFISVLFLPDRKNAYVLAITLPLFSYFVSGHPIAVKNSIMAAELFVNVFVFYKLLDMKVNSFFSCFISILFSKILYYGLKYAVVSAGLLSANVIDTSIFIQIIITVLLSILFWIVYRKQKSYMV